MRTLGIQRLYLLFNITHAENADIWPFDFKSIICQTLLLFLWMTFGLMFTHVEKLRRCMF